MLSRAWAVLKRSSWSSNVGDPAGGGGAVQLGDAAAMMIGAGGGATYASLFDLAAFIMLVASLLMPLVKMPPMPPTINNTMSFSILVYAWSIGAIALIGCVTNVTE